MKIFNGFKKINGPTIVVLGTFDGVHEGHTALINKALEISENEVSPVVVCTFKQHPLNVINKDIRVKLLSSIPEKIKKISKLGADALCLIDFDKKFSCIKPEEFIELLCDSFSPEHIVVGYNYKFGSKASGDCNTLKLYGDKYGYKTHVIEKVLDDGIAVSSSRIRKLISAGNINDCNKLLQSNYKIDINIINIDRKLIVARPNLYKATPLQGVYSCVLNSSYRKTICLLRINQGVYNIIPIDKDHDFKKTEFKRALLFFIDHVAIENRAHS